MGTQMPQVMLTGNCDMSQELALVMSIVSSKGCIALSTTARMEEKVILLWEESALRSQSLMGTIEY